MTQVLAQDMAREVNDSTEGGREALRPVECSWLEFYGEIQLYVYLSDHICISFEKLV